MYRAPFAHKHSRPALLRALLVSAAFFSTFVPASSLFAKAPANALPYGYSDEDLLAAKPKAKPTAPAPADAAKVSSFASVSGLSAFQMWNENDIFWSDRYYTNGLKLAYTTPEIWGGDRKPLFVQDLLKFSPLAENTAINPAIYRLHFALTQEINTPLHEHFSEIQPGDHPYSGLLYGTVALSSETRERLDALEFSAGVIGPSAQSSQTQNKWHYLIGEKLAKGWDNQLRDEPIFQLGWTRAGRYTWFKKDSLQIDWHPRLHVEVGTVRDYVSVGAQWRIGWSRDGLPRDFGIATIRSSPVFTRPTESREFSGLKPDAAWLYVDVQGEGWLWNSPLDGNLWHASSRAKGTKVSSIPWVGEAVIGVAVQWGSLRLNLAEVIRSKEFRGQHDEVFVFHTASLSFSF